MWSTKWTSMIYRFTWNQSTVFSFNSYWEFVSVGSLCFTLFSCHHSLIIYLVLKMEQFAVSKELVNWASFSLADDFLAVLEIAKISMVAVYFIFIIWCCVFTIRIGDWNFMTLLSLLAMIFATLGSLISLIASLWSRRNLSKQIELMNLNENIRSDLIDEICLICQDDFSGSNPICSPCNHYFHKRCIRKWLLIKATCPYCNGRLDLPHLETKEKERRITDFNRLLQNWNPSGMLLQNREENEARGQSRSSTLRSGPEECLGHFFLEVPGRGTGWGLLTQLKHMNRGKLMRERIQYGFSLTIF